MSSKTQNQILSAGQIERILDRIAIQILENNFEAKAVELVGINGQGFQMAKKLVEKLSKQEKGFTVGLTELFVDKQNPVAADIKLDKPLEVLNDKSIILIDDVMNTGRTQAYSLAYIMKAKVLKVETAVLVNRSHTRFPISATFSGISLSTTIDEHIEVRLEQNPGAFLY